MPQTIACPYHSYFPVTQRLVLGIYAIFYAAVLPFICWGTAADPGHPHAASHFVFFTDPHAFPADHFHPQPSDPHEHSEPVGRSTPDTLAVEILTIILLAVSLLLIEPFRQTVGLLPVQIMQSLASLVPTPPPRLFV